MLDIQNTPLEAYDFEENVMAAVLFADSFNTVSFYDSQYFILNDEGDIFVGYAENGETPLFVHPQDFSKFDTDQAIFETKEACDHFIMGLTVEQQQAFEGAVFVETTEDLKQPFFNISKLKTDHLQAMQFVVEAKDVKMTFNVKGLSDLLNSLNLGDVNAPVTLFKGKLKMQTRSHALSVASVRFVQKYA